MKPDPKYCAEFDDLAILYAAGELSEEARAAVESHVRDCDSCAAKLQAEIDLRAAILKQEPVVEKLDRSDLLLARCRSELSETLEAAGATGPKQHWYQRLLPGRWTGELRRVLVVYPGWSAAALLLAGALGGTAVRTWYSQTMLPLPGKPVMTVSAAPRLSDKELETMGIEGIRWMPQGDAGDPQVQVQLLSKKPMVVEGTPDDAEIRRVLTYVVEHGEKFDPGLRLDSLDVLRTRVSDPLVRAALCQAARNDSDAAVRLKALDALGGLGADPDVQQTMLGALASDDNSGVRIEAVNALMAALGNAGMPAMHVPPQALEVLRDREQNDSNNYVRLGSARVLSRLASADGDSSRDFSVASTTGGPHP